MTSEDELSLKTWLFSLWQKHKQANFFLAGAVIGQVEDICGLAKKYGIDEKTTKEFLNRFNICDRLIRERDRIIMIRSVYRWTLDKAIPQNINAILETAKDEKAKYPWGYVKIEEDESYTLFSDGVKEKPKPKPEESIEKWWERESQEASYCECELFYRLVSRDERTRAYERMLRTLYRNKALVLMKEVKEDFLAEISFEIHYYFDEAIKKATTAEEIFKLHCMMRLDKYAIEEILKAVDNKRRNCDESECDEFRAEIKLEHFYDFVKLWREFRNRDLEVLESQAWTFDVDLEEMFKEAVEKVKREKVKLSA